MSLKIYEPLKIAGRLPFQSLFNNRPNNIFYFFLLVTSLDFYNQVIRKKLFVKYFFKICFMLI